jgi:heme exporter protein B
MTPFIALVRRDVRLAWRAGGGAALALGFFACVASLLPLGIGPDLPLLARSGGGILWLTALLAALLSLERLFQADAEDGSLEIIALSPLPLELAALAKIVAHWLASGLPLTLAALPLALMFGLAPAPALLLAASLAAGTPAVSALGAAGAALTLPARRGGLLLPLIVLPLLAPLLIFGTGAAAAAGGPDNGAFLLLLAFAVPAVLLSPFVAAAGLRLHLAE